MKQKLMPEENWENNYVLKVKKLLIPEENWENNYVLKVKKLLKRDKYLQCEESTSRPLHRACKG